MSVEKPDLTRGGKLPWLRTERRKREFKEVLSGRMLRIAGIGAIFVLVDPRLTMPVGDGWMMSFGGQGFSLDLKGLVIGAILIGGFNSIREHWLGASASGQKAAEVVERMAESAAPTAALVAEKTLAVVTGKESPAPPTTLAEALAPAANKPGAEEPVIVVKDAHIEADTATIKERESVTYTEKPKG